MALGGLFDIVFVGGVLRSMFCWDCLTYLRLLTRLPVALMVLLCRF